MIEVAVIVSLIALIGWQEYNNRKERGKLINAIMSKTPEQFRDIEFTEKVEPVKVPVSQPDLIPMDQLSDEDWKKAMNNELGGVGE